MKIGLATINTKIADLRGNTQKIQDFSLRAREMGADIVVTPELSVCGYIPNDLLFYDGFLKEIDDCFEELKHRLPNDTPVVVGRVRKDPQTEFLYNTASILYRGQEVLRQDKVLLPNYDVFDERRFFQPGTSYQVWDYLGYRIGLLICEDFWFISHLGSFSPYSTDPVQEIVNRGATLLLGISASPFEVDKNNLRKQLIKNHSRKHGIPIVYHNLVGGNDGLIFDGSSFSVNARGKVVYEVSPFEEKVDVFPLDISEIDEKSTEPMKQIFNALVMGTRDFVHKSGFRKVHLGLSGGIDSALVAVIAQEALGNDNVQAFSLPSRFSSPSSYEDAKQLASNLGIGFEKISIEKVYESSRDTLGHVLGPNLEGTPSENLQARIRGLLLMAWSNAHPSLLLTTGNKSELATGYCTLYGDMAGSLAVIGDLFKTQVYALCRWINSRSPTIPENILVKAPSAELRENQTDQDSLPPYDLLDRILHLHLIENKTAKEIDIAPPEIVAKVLRMVAISEHKRFQAPPVLKVSSRSFGVGRRMTLSRSYPETFNEF